MDQLEITVQKHVENFCKILHSHVERWKVLLQNAVKPIQTISNYAEQLRHVREVSVVHLEELSEIQKNVVNKILDEVEYEICTLKDIVDQMNATNLEIRNKLSLLERSTIDLNWDNNSQLLLGTALQPPLWKILQEGLKFWLYFAKITKHINSQIKNFNITDVKLMTGFENSFKLDLEDSIVTCLLSKTQYVSNEKHLV